jgi:hypothetical protein
VTGAASTVGGTLGDHDWRRDGRHHAGRDGRGDASSRTLGVTGAATLTGDR